jgi:hypothetical protein
VQREARPKTSQFVRRGLRLLLPAVVIAGLAAPLVGQEVASAATTGVTFVPGSVAAHATSTWTVGFTTSSTGALASPNIIQVTFDAGFGLPTTPAVTFVSGFTGTCTGTPTGTTAGQVVTITLSGTCALANSTGGTLTIAGVTNPGAGSHPAAAFGVTTSQDTIGNPASPVVITATSPSGATFTPGSTVALATSTWTVGFTTSASGALAATNTIKLTFNAGFTIPAAPAVTFPSGFTGCGATTGSTTGQVVTITLPAGCLLANSTAGTVTVAGITNPGAGSYPGFSVATSQDVTPNSIVSPVLIGAPSSVTFTPGSTVANATSTWTVGFTSSAAGALVATNTISVTFNSNFTLPASPTITWGSGFTGSCSGTTTGATTGHTVTLILGGGCALANSTAATVTIAGVTNPVAGSYPANTFSVATTADTTPANPASPVVIGATPLSGVTFTPGSSVAAGISTWTVGFTTSSGGALASPNTIAVTFNPAFTIPATPTVTFHSGFTGTCTGTTTGATVGQVVTITLSGTCALASSTAATVTIAGITNPIAGTYPANTFSVATSQDSTPVNPAAAVVITGAASAATTTITASPTAIVANGTSTSTITVQAKDATGHNLTTSGGTVVLATTRGTLGAVTDNGNGTYTATLTSSATAGTATVSGTLNGAAIASTATVTFTSTTATLTQGPPTSATVPFGAGFSGQLTVTGATGTVTYVEASSPSSGIVVVNATGAISAAPATAPGSYAVSGTEFDTNGNIGTWSFTLTVNPSGPPPATTGYWLVASDGGIFSFGNASFFGSTGALHLNQPIVGMASTPDSGGYWLVAADGGIFAFGDAGFFGSTGAIHLNKPIVGMASTPDGRGYWLVASDGGIFAFGDAGFFGSTGAIHLNQPVVGMTSTPDGRGYWMVASDGGIFAFGTARFFGSMGGSPLNKPIVGMDFTPSGGGYWLVASDGGIFAFGDAGFFGSTGAIHLNQPVVGMTSTNDGMGYWFVAADGGIFAFGDAPFNGSMGGSPLNKPIVGMAAT